MSSVQDLRDFINKRLTAATEEILGVFEQTVRVYEEEIDRQRKLLDMVLKPEITLHRTEMPQSDCEKVHPDQQLCKQEGTPSLDQEVHTKPLQIKEELEEQPVPEQESVSSTLRLSGEESDNIKDQTLLLDPQLLTNVSVKVTQSESETEGSDLSEPSGYRHVASNSHRAESKDCERGNQENASTDLKLENKYIKCLSCSEEFRDVLELNIHRRIHFEKSFNCDICGKGFSQKAVVMRHMMIHTDEKPFRCRVCGKDFRSQSNCASHMKTHTGERPYICFTCGKSFSLRTDLKRHIRSHTGEKPHSCIHCGRGFSRRSSLNRHARVHTGEKPYGCTLCGKRFALKTTLKNHTKLYNQCVTTSKQKH